MHNVCSFLMGYSRKTKDIRIMINSKRPKIFLAFLLTAGEFWEYHVSCLSVWQWAKHELRNTPFLLGFAKPLIKFTIRVLKPVTHMSKVRAKKQNWLSWLFKIKNINSSCSTLQELDLSWIALGVVKSTIMPTSTWICRFGS